ncbi:MAG: NAD(+) synthase [Candidatus Omnitrophica bacterium]|nr:NAD(+) synthase [Candidatus Omnitrophota bacterium]
MLSYKISDWIKDEVKKAEKVGIVLGLSGGLDSAVVACLAKKAMGEDALALILPCQSSADDVRYAKMVTKVSGIKTKTISLDKIYDEFLKTNSEAKKIARSNLKPRLRMTMLYCFANSLNYLVAGTGNKSEISVGYFTKYGDGGSDILPLGDLVKSEVRKLAAELGVPDDVINRAPSAGLWEGQTDEGEMGITYKELDEIILALEKNNTEKIDKSKLAMVQEMIKKSEHKRKNIPIFKNIN